MGLPNLLPISPLFTGTHFLGEPVPQLPFTPLAPVVPQTYHAFLDISTWQPKTLSPHHPPPVGLLHCLPSPILLASIQSWSPLLLPKPGGSRDADLVLPGVGLIDLSPSTQGIAMVTYLVQGRFFSKVAPIPLEPLPGGELVPLPLDKHKDVHGLQNDTNSVMAVERETT